MMQKNTDMVESGWLEWLCHWSMTNKISKTGSIYMKSQGRRGGDWGKRSDSTYKEVSPDFETTRVSVLDVKYWKDKRYLKLSR